MFLRPCRHSGRLAMQKALIVLSDCPKIGALVNCCCEFEIANGAQPLAFSFLVLVVAMSDSQNVAKLRNRPQES